MCATDSECLNPLFNISGYAIVFLLAGELHPVSHESPGRLRS